MIEIRHLSKSYEDGTVLNDVNASINKGDVIALIGPSGCGKSTLLRCINLLIKPTGGEIILDGENILQEGYNASKVRQKVGMVFQSFNLFNNMTVIENIMTAPIDLLKMSKQEAYDKAMELLNKVGLGSRALNYPSQLSGGQKQRVAICRTLAMNPEIILFDEPTSALDPTMVDEVKAVIIDLAKQGNTMIIVTHDMDFAKTVATRVFYVDEGTIYEEGTPAQIFDHCKKEKTKIFVKQLKQLKFVFEDGDLDFGPTIYKIDDFCYRHHIPLKTLNGILLVYEELCKEILLPILGKNKLMVCIDYAKKTGTVSMEVSYTGYKYNPNETDKKLSLKIIKKISSSFTYKYVNEEYCNKIQIAFSNDK